MNYFKFIFTYYQFIYLLFINIFVDALTASHFILLEVVTMEK